MSTDTGRQIKQMINFIMQEAHEKVNEIRIKTDHDFNLEKQNLVQSGKLKVQEEYAQKEKDLEVQHRV
jgi:V-type H+-transporting ATPase subunit E